MLIRLTPDQISDYWDIIAPTIEATIAPVSRDPKNEMSNVLGALLAEEMQCWFISSDASGQHVAGIVTTCLSHDFISNTASLLIYSLYSVRPLSRLILKDIRDALSKYARFRKASRIVAYTKDETLANIINKETEEDPWYFLSIELKSKETQ